MNKDIISGKWQEIKEKLKQQWRSLNDEDIAKMQGTHEGLQGLLQMKYGYQRNEAKKEIEKFLKINGWDK